ncbi:outer membrane protein/peptidoglycan-associated (lipo)protein [Beggiatoa alba B18LD]|uniref:Outer membrane protein/peptidoglycan-associated (Lipo)protein n=2 Tax=Beggiatoa alba TaxID=1022 RepID=I3CE28_9GAMM|nr:outer membrane protein/peptidoglycan-associated (lipo)protein [Beggiatoa alba B18LD]
MLIVLDFFKKGLVLCLLSSVLVACSSVPEQVDGSDDNNLAATALDAERARTDALNKAILDSVRSQQVSKGLLITLNDSLFETGKAELLTASSASIDKIASFLHQNPTRNILIEGYTDSTGSHDYNLGLSQRRADAVKYAFISRGVASKRIIAKGYGEKSPIADNQTLGGRQKNRRIEITVLNEGLAAR